MAFQGPVVQFYDKHELRQVPLQDFWANHTDGATAEDICITVAKYLNIAPLQSFLFALRELRIQENIHEIGQWLSPQRKITSQDYDGRIFEFRFRFLTANDEFVSRLFENDQSAFSYLFNQCHYDFVQNRLTFPKSFGTDFKIGIAVLDAAQFYFSEDPKPKLNRLKLERFLSKAILAEVPRFKKVRLSGTFCQEVENLVKKYGENPHEKNGVSNCRRQYITALLKKCAKYTAEQFRTCDRVIHVDPNHERHPGIYFESNTSGEVELVCKIEDLSDMATITQRTHEASDTASQSTSSAVQRTTSGSHSAASEAHSATRLLHSTTSSAQSAISADEPWVVQIFRNNGVPKFVEFLDQETAESFLALIDGHRRLLVDFYTSICNVIQPPSLKFLRENKCHGPYRLDPNLIKDCLMEQRSKHKLETFMVKQRATQYDEYRLYFTVKNEGVKDSIIQRNPQGKFQVKAENNSEPQPTFESIRELLDHYKEKKHIKLVHAVTADSNSTPKALKEALLLLKTRNVGCDLPDGEPKPPAKQITISLPNTVFIGSRIIGQGYYTDVYEGAWQMPNQEKRKVAVKKLKPECDQLLQYLLHGAQKHVQWQHPAFMTINTLVLAPFMIVMEYGEGTLWEWLQQDKDLISRKQHYLIEIAIQIGEALTYLNSMQSGFIHGAVRCKNILVKKAVEEGITVKLMDPGLAHYYNSLSAEKSVNEERLPWLAPEYYLDDLGLPSEKSDVYSLGMTLVECAHSGHKPLPPDYNIAKMKLLGEQGVLSIINAPGVNPKNFYEEIVVKCLHRKPEERCVGHDVARDSNQKLHEFRHYQQDALSLQEELNRHGAGFEVIPAGLNPVETQYSVRLPKRSPNFPSVSTNDSQAPLLSPGTPSSDGTFGGLRNPGLVDHDHEVEPIRVEPALSQPIYEFDKTHKILGQGYYGVVMLGRLRNKQDPTKWQRCAIKQLKSDKLKPLGQKEQAKELEDFRNEIKLQSSLHHPNIVQTYDSTETRDGSLILMLEYVENGSLEKYIKKADPGIIIRLAQEITEGMIYLHSKNIVHRDLAARNVLITFDHHAKISDFGLTRSMTPDKDYYKVQTKRNLPIYWYGPEFFHFSGENAKVGREVDVWSFGVTLWEMYWYNFGQTSTPPVHLGPSRESIKQNNLAGKTVYEANMYLENILTKKLRLPCMTPNGKSIPVNVYAIMMECWNNEWAKRITFDQVRTKLAAL
ncbi:unnamed protein product [Owenia fusiformis]|uniref:Non-specific protein-tyrosine kinase n=1 Tax=Owenia fusiformis TaxID=6347 RepID=A0A8J1TX56_OWEFU|nr:unnamed protein product [Owenia fusiformis]